MTFASFHYVAHWPTRQGYNFISGPLADITIITGFAGAAVAHLRRHRCHVRRCWRLEWHPHPEHGHPVCKRHHPHAEMVTGAGLPRTSLGRWRG